MAKFNWTVDDIKRAQRDFSNNFMRLDCIRTESYDVAIDCMTECIEKKATDVQPVCHGRWIEQRHTPTNGYNYNVPYSTYVCSSCGLEIHNDEYSKYVRGTYTNCPVCTARMDGEK